MLTTAEVRHLLVRIGLDDGLSRGVNKTLGSVGKLEKGLGRAGKGAGQLSAGLLKAGVVGAAAAAGGLAFAAKTAIDMDDAFAGVRKTVSASEPELNALNDELHALATRIPVKYTDLAGIAAEAGALGVPTKAVAKFTEVVARLSASTQGLTVEAAAEAFGKFRNTLHLADADLTRAASSLIALGNAGASSEGDIIEVGKRFAAAGHQAGLSAAQVLGFSSAITSLGVEPEAAGSSLSRLFNNITKYIGTGSDKITAFAKTSGTSVATFKKLFAKDATGAVLEFLTGLGKLNKFQAANVLKNAGITNVRDINAVLLLSQNVGELKRQLGLSSDAFAKNTELADVSAKRFDTLKNKITVLKNNFLEAGYNIAQGFLPALGRATDRLTTFLQLPETKSALKDLGKDLGDLIDKIDWGELERAAKGAVKAIKPMVDLLLTVAKALNALPAEVKGAGLAAIVANKASGGLIGSGLGNIVGGLAGALTKSLAASIPLFGRAFVQPVFVTNLGGLGGGLPGTGNQTGGGTAGGFAGLGSVAALGFVLSGTIQTALKDAFTGLFPNASPLASAPLDISRNTTVPGFDVLTHLDQLPGQFDRFINFLTGQSNSLLPATRDMDKNLASAKTVLDRLAAQGITLKAGVDTLAQNFRDGLKGLASSNPKAIRESINKVVQAIEAGRGNAKNTLSVLARLKNDLKHTHDPALQAALRSAIKSVERKVPGREYVQRQLNKADKIINSNLSNGQKINRLQTIAAEVGRKSKTAGERVRQKIAQLQTSEAVRLRDANRHLAAIQRKKTTFTVHNTIPVNVTIRETTQGIRLSSRVARSTSLAVR